MNVIHVAPRPPGYNPLEEKRLDPQTIQLTLNSTPTGAPVDFGEGSGTTPFTTTTAIGYQTNVSDYDKIIELDAQLKAVQEERAQVEEAWLELAEQVPGN